VIVRPLRDETPEGAQREEVEITGRAEVSREAVKPPGLCRRLPKSAVSADFPVGRRGVGHLASVLPMADREAWGMVPCVPSPHSMPPRWGSGVVFGRFSIRRSSLTGLRCGWGRVGGDRHVRAPMRASRTAPPDLRRVREERIRSD